ncbi:MAG: AAA family ATPase [Proteobacteria bacterium]|nr:AAA family ATPase [Pseudomonadota bacterium]MBU4296634.1 AAA family ATPase [Pseudomonadota bacterium]MCG2748263.1 AAA family ATPase [Desulfobulbaceae bacterium]
MYQEHFGFTAAPFSIAPDPHSLYMSERHKEALAHLFYGMRVDGGFVMLTGEVGTGKTTICRCLLEQVPENTDIAFIFNPKLTVEELLATICDEFGIHHQKEQNSIKFYVDHINSFLLHSHANGRKAVLIIDEAQNLSTDVLEQIRLLTNLETNTRKLLQIILLGQPELIKKLAQPGLRQLAQRITARYHLTPLSESEVGSYIDHRLAINGCRKKIFPESTIKTLFKLTNGTPRLLNIICDRSLLGAYVQDQDMVDIATIKKAAREVFGEIADRPDRTVKKSGMLIAGIILLLGASVLAAAYLKQRPDTLFGQGPMAPLVEITQPEEDVAQLATESLPALKQAQEAPQTEDMKAVPQQSAAPDDGALAEEIDATANNTPPPALPSREQAQEAPQAADMKAVPQQSPALDDDAPAGKIDAAADSTPPPALTPLTRPEGVPLASSMVMAHQALLASWGITHVPVDLASASAVAESHNLRYLTQEGSFNSLVELNRPAILSLYDNFGERFYATIVSFDGQSAELVFGTEHKRVSIEDFKTHWKGEYCLLWEKPEEYVMAIKPGNHAAKVEWLDKKLALIQKRPASTQTPVLYDNDLVSQVKQFQFERNLVPDGIVGPLTIIHLNSAYNSKVPKLVATGEEK